MKLMVFGHIFRLLELARKGKHNKKVEEPLT